MRIELGTEIVDITITRSKRKTACLRIRPDGSIEVRGPYMMSDEFVKSFVLQKSEWIKRKRQEALEKQKKKKDRSYTSGESFPYLGEEYVLTLIAGGRKKIELSQGKMLVYTTSFEARNIEMQIKEWYKNQAMEYIQSRLAYFKPYISGDVKSVVMENRKKRWGSCSSQRELTFNWRLILAPSFVIDYVVVHELCHLKHMNHSPSFWKEVERILPDYKIRKKWLEDNGVTLQM